ncbi:MAG TPA: hypothetical protein VMB50_06190, partial [Myxococcales bacterium]|nr:hypothetical protein [Myxococcales bacterium]
LLLAVSLASASVLSLSARADQNDLSIYKLGNPDTDPNATARFRMLGNELGVSLSGTTLEPPTTVGADGFSFTFEYTFAFVNGTANIGGQPYWVTQSPNPSVLMLPALHFRKGLPYSIEFGGKVQTITNSGLFAGTVEARWGIVEGFRYLPDLAVRFAMTRLFGQPDMDLTTGEISGSLGKEFGVAGTVTLTPYLGYGVIGVDSSSRVLLANQDTETAQQYASQPAAGQILFTENTVGNNLYNRFYFGLRLRSNIVSLTIEYSYAWAQTAGMPVDEPLQQLSASAGLTF